MQKKVMLIDGNSIVNRAFYGVPKLTNNEGLYTNAVYGFLNILFKLLDEEKPDYLAVAYDLKAPTFRHEAFEDYKGKRKAMPEELASQIPMLKELLSAFKIKQYSMEGYEADDILGTLSKKAEEKGFSTVVVSGDRDLLQLASDTLKVRIPKTKAGKTEVEDYFSKDVFEKYGVTPLEFIELKGLMGDSSDNIPGVPGIGEKTATKIIQEFKTIENAIANAEKVKPPRASGNLKEFQEQARLSKSLATIKRDMPIELELENMTVSVDKISDQAYQLLKKYGFKSMLGRFETNEEETVEEKTHYKIVFKKEEIEKYLLSAKGEETAYILFVESNHVKGISLYNEKNHGVYIKIDEENLDNIMSSLKVFFEEEEFIKIGHNIKDNIKVLKGFDIALKGVSFDTAIGAYVLNPVKDSYDFDDLAAEFLQKTIKSEEEVLGKGKSRISIDLLSEKELGEFAAVQAEIIYNSKKVIAQKLSENNQDNLFYNIEMPLIFVLSDMESQGIKVDKKGLLEYQNNLEEELDIITKEIYLLSGEEFNINSPKQLGVILFEKLGLKGGKKTKTGYSTAAEVLEKLKTESPVVEKVLFYRQLAKLKSTYADGLLNVMDEKTERIYSTFNQTITATGRISSTEPNLQNIPIRLDLGRQLRKVFIPNEGCVFLDADYSQIELRVLAHMAEDETLINAFKEGQDIHRLTASQVFNIPFDQVTPAQRSNAKAVNFGIVYGIGAFSLSQDLNITVKEAEKYIGSYFKKYPNIRKYMDTTIENARTNGYVSTIFGRRRAMPELSASNFIQRSFGERVAMNMPIQGSAADIIKIAMIKVHKELKAKNFKSKIILQVHDELLIEAYEDEAEEVSKLLKFNMENAVSLKVPMEVEVKVGKSWYETK